MALCLISSKFGFTSLSHIWSMKSKGKWFFLVTSVNFMLSMHILYPVIVLVGINSFFSFFTTVTPPFLGITWPNYCLKSDRWSQLPRPSWSPSWQLLSSLSPASSIARSRTLTHPPRGSCACTNAETYLKCHQENRKELCDTCAAYLVVKWVLFYSS